MESAEEVRPAPPTAPPVTTPLVTTPLDNETYIWNYLIGQGFTREQTAGILGNLKQEHNFNTSDVPGGLGIAQWMGGRRARLISKGNHLDLQTQLDFMMEEFRTYEALSYRLVLGSKTVADATIAFQNGFERCGDCRQSQRINYAQQILGKH